MCRNGASNLGLAIGNLNDADLMRDNGVRDMASSNTTNALGGSLDVTDERPDAHLSTLTLYAAQGALPAVELCSPTGQLKRQSKGHISIEVTPGRVAVRAF